MQQMRKYLLLFNHLQLIWKIVLILSRPKKDELAEKAIMENAQMDPYLRANANALESALQRQENRELKQFEYS